MTHPELEQAALDVKEWCLDLFHNRNEDGTLLVLAGPSGCGKTRLAKGAWKFVRENGSKAWDRGHWRRSISDFWVDWSDLIDREGLLEDVYTSTFVVLDDIGSEADKFNSGVGIERLRKVLGHRDHKWTIVTTNFTPDKWLNRWDARVADRLLRHSRIVEFNQTPSYAAWSRSP